MSKSSMNANPTTIQATTPQLLKASGLALAVAGAILVTAVLPAEYGIDPTGIGSALGLTALSAKPAAAAPPATTTAESVLAVPSPSDAVVKRATPFHSEEMSLTLVANQGAEIKAAMKVGERFEFSWRSEGGPVSFDMHGEKPNDGDNFSSYWKDRDQSEAHGSFVAPFDGVHGWYWKNRGSEPVTVTVKVSGYFDKLYMP
ncbi:hypothetical protein [Nevskia ramosa]|uniref:hypothetical protein n=2 Tax=Nevskia ramosa TaxID=64002 RepID=UPI0023540EE1|nr:hypothetical protein [Nevskia ramosa]